MAEIGDSPQHVRLEIGLRAVIVGRSAEGQPSCGRRSPPHTETETVSMRPSAGNPDKTTKIEKGRRESAISKQVGDNLLSGWLHECMNLIVSRAKRGGMEPSSCYHLYCKQSSSCCQAVALLPEAVVRGRSAFHHVAINLIACSIAEAGRQCGGQAGAWRTCQGATGQS